MEKYLFIAGMPKCGTTSLATWLVENDIAEYFIPGMKEPNLYSRSDFGKFPLPYGNGSKKWRLDASNSYGLNRYAVNNMPEHFTRIIVCIKNHWERTWSNYKMFKLMAQNNKEWGEIARNDFPMGEGASWLELENFSETFFKSNTSNIIAQYHNLEKQRLLKSNFQGRINYELNFYFSRGIFPFYSSLWGSRYSLILRNLIEKYSPSNIHFVDISLLNDDAKRDRFTKNVLQSNCKTSPITEKLVGKNIKFNEEKPDFSSPDLNFLKSFFRHDLEDFERQIKKFGLTTDFIDFDYLRKNIT